MPKLLRYFKYRAWWNVAKRIQALVTPTLAMLCRQSRKPKHSPKQFADTLKDKICALRERLSERYHRAAGAETIQYLLKGEMPFVDYYERIKADARFIEQYRRFHWKQTGEWV